MAMTMHSDRRIFFGWWMVLVGGTGLLVGYVPTVSFTFSVFMPSLVETFGWTRGQVSAAYSISLITMMIAMPVIGRLVDSFGAKRIILPSSLVLGLCLASMSMLTNHLWHFYGLFVLMGLVGAGTLPLAYSAVIAHWFDRKRGIALGLTMVGLGLGASLTPSLAGVLIDAVGWQRAYLILGTAVIAIGFPVVGLFLRERPEPLGLRPDGEPPTSAPPRSGNVEGMSIREAARTRTFWLMCTVFFLTGMGVIGSLIHFVPMLMDHGVSARTAALATSTIGISLIVGRVGAGFLLDHFFAVRIAVVFLLGVALGILLLWIGVSNWLVFVAAFLLGMGLGAESDLTPYLVSRYFGLKSFTECYGYTNASNALGGVVGPWLLGFGFDRFGSYSVVLAAFGIAAVIALLLITQLPPYRYAPAGFLATDRNQDEAHVICSSGEEAR